jgi:hypothetical protein
MDPLLGGTFSDVPERIPPVPAAVYDLRVEKVEIKPNKNSTGNNLVAHCKVDNEGPAKGRKLTQYIGLPNSTDDSDAVMQKKVRVKQFFIACSVEPEPNGGYDIKKLVGALLKASVSIQLTTDPNTNTQIEQNNVSVLRPNGARF